LISLILIMLEIG